MIPPKGETATTTVKDAEGRTTELIQHTNAARTTSQSTTCTYTPSGEKKTVTDANKSTWTYTYDKRDRVTRVDDPDRGPLTTTYDAADRPVTTKDANGAVLSTAYDPLGRKTEPKQGTTTLAGWEYDTLAKGHLTRSVRHIAGQRYVSETTGLDARYNPTGTRITIPAREGGLAGTYDWTYALVAFGYAVLSTVLAFTHQRYDMVMSVILVCVAAAGIARILQPMPRARRASSWCASRSARCCRPSGWCT